MPRTRSFSESDVLQKAVNVFWKNGYHATSMQDLVDHLGINRASLYATFGDKRGLFERAIDTYSSQNFQSVSAYLEGQTTLLNGLRGLLYGLVDMALADHDCKGCMVVNTTTELLPGDNEILGLLLENQRNFEAIFLRFLSLGQQRGELAADANIEALASYLYTFQGGLQVIAKVERDRAKLIATVDAALGVFSLA